jgi:hypothetical protein
MNVDGELAIIGGLMAALGITVVVVFLWYWGTFRYPVFVWVSILITMGITYFQSFGVFPYDIATTITGHNTTAAVTDTVYWLATADYWGGFFMGWWWMPLFVFTHQYRYGTTWRKSFWYSLRFNIIWYLVAGVICGAGLLMIIIRDGFHLDSIVALCIALCNGYGLILLMSALGHGLIELPRQIWKMSSPERKLKTCLDWLNLDAEASAQASVNGLALIDACNQARRTMSPKVSEEILPCLEPRQVQLEEQSRLQSLPVRWYNVKPEEVYTAGANIDYGPLTVEDLELKILALCDEINSQMEDYYWDVDYWISEAEKTMRWMVEWHEGKVLARLKTYVRYVLVAFLVILHGVICWGEVCLIPTFKKEWEWMIEYGPWYILCSYVKENWDPVLIMVGFVIPIIGYFIFLGSWLSTYLHMGKQFYRFIPHHANENTVYYFNLCQSRISCALIYHFLLQIGDHGQDTETFKVYGKMSQVAFIGDKFNELMPIGTFVVMFIIIFRLWQRCMAGLGCKQIHISPDDMTAAELRDGFDIIRCARHDLSELLNHEVIKGILAESPMLMSSVEPLRTSSVTSYF